MLFTGSGSIGVGFVTNARSSLDCPGAIHSSVVPTTSFDLRLGARASGDILNWLRELKAHRTNSSTS